MLFLPINLQSKLVLPGRNFSHLFDQSAFFYNLSGYFDTMWSLWMRTVFWVMMFSHLFIINVTYFIGHFPLPLK